MNESYSDTSPLALPTQGALISLADVPHWRQCWHDAGKKIVATNGCFDLLHVGHLRYLAAARALGDFLWVGINDDAAVTQLKGKGRPITKAEERAEILLALRIVDAVTIFPSVKATEFLRAVCPDIYVKGGDYTEDSLDAEEKTALRDSKTKIQILPLVPNRSTTSMIKKMKPQ